MKPVLIVIMDGVGFSKTGIGDCVTLANTPTLDKLLKECPNVRLKAHGTAVGLPTDDDMGNSEVGHNAIGCGQIYAQGAQLVNNSIESGKMYASKHGTSLSIMSRTINRPYISSAFCPTAMFTQYIAPFGYVEEGKRKRC